MTTAWVVLALINIALAVRNLRIWWRTRNVDKATIGVSFIVIACMAFLIVSYT